ncbi:MAG: acyl-CoA dehydrogenase family protein, partial [Patescibacteria group bacterium]
VSRIASSAKFIATETAWKVASKVMTTFGGMAVTKELRMFPRFMDVFPTLIYEGANNIQEIVIAKHLYD